MSRVQVALRVSDLEGSIAFYRRLFGVQPAKRRPGDANFAVAEPPLKLVLLEGQPDQQTVLDHLGVEVETTDEVNAATPRLSELGLLTQVEKDATCCYARQDKVWVHGPGAEPWGVYTVKDYSDNFCALSGAPNVDEGGAGATRRPAACRTRLNRSLVARAPAPLLPERPTRSATVSTGTSSTPT